MAGQADSLYIWKSNNYILGRFASVTEADARISELAKSRCGSRVRWQAWSGGVLGGIPLIKGSGDKEIRTPDPLLAKQVLYQLSYTPKNG